MQVQKLLGKLHGIDIPLRSGSLDYILLSDELSSSKSLSFFKIKY